MSKPFAPVRASWEMPRPLPFLTPYPVEIRLQRQNAAIDLDARILATGDMDFMAELAELRLLHTRGDVLPVELEIADLDLPPGGYTIKLTPRELRLRGQDAAGLFYARQTFLQVAGFLSGRVPELFIRDYPRYPVRAVMIDMGRGIFTKELLKQVIRRISRLKYNVLHMHLFDDQLMGLRFETLPQLGRENPYALSIADLKEIIDYARTQHVEVAPEIESWGHVGSIIHHYPELFGAPGQYEGRAIGISPRSFDLFERMYREIVPLVSDRAMVHLGLDEASWKTLDDLPEPENWNPERLVGELHTRLQRVARDCGKSIRTAIWADHGGRPVPQEFRNEIIVEPWAYHEWLEDEIVQYVRKYTAAGAPFIMGAGESSAHPAGAFGATRIWCREAFYSPNCLGVAVCLWEGNDFTRQLVSVFGGATPAWNPLAADVIARDRYRERAYNAIGARLRSYQTLFEDAAEETIIQARGPRVFRGFFLDGPQAGLPVAETVTEVEREVHDWE